MSVLEVKEEIAKMEAEKKAFRFDLVRICWYMRGSISWEQAWELSFEDKKIISEFLKDNMERFKGSMTPIV